MNPWIGVDLDGTLAVYDGWRGPEHIGPPVPAMVERVKRWNGKAARTPHSKGRMSERVAVLLLAQWGKKNLVVFEQDDGFKAGVMVHWTGADGVLRGEIVVAHGKGFPTSDEAEADIKSKLDGLLEEARYVACRTS